MLKRPPKIEDIEIHLDTNYADKGGFGEFDRQVKLMKSGGMIAGNKVTKASIARHFEVNKDTIYTWLPLYERKLKNGA